MCVSVFIDYSKRSFFGALNIEFDSLCQNETDACENLNASAGKSSRCSDSFV